VLSSNIEQIAFSYNTLVELEDTRSRRSSRSGSASDPADVENREKSSRSNSLEDLSTSSNQSRVNLTISVEKEEEVANDLEIDHLKDVCGSLDLPSAFDEYSLHRQKKIEKSIKL
jgi:hypothetical protein